MSAPAIRQQLEAVSFPGSLTERIMNLGIWRPVSAGAVEDEISALEAMLAERRKRRAT